MSTKESPGAFDCYANAKPDEPMFVLLGRDRHAAVLVNLWAAMRRLEGESPDVIEEADKRADELAMYCMKLGKEPVGAQGIALGVAMFAEMVGAVITIGQEPLQPLRMGNYRHTVQVRVKPQPAPLMERGNG